MRVDIRLLGGFTVVVDGRPAPEDAWRRRNASALVKLLALHPGRRLRREQVIDALWPDLLLEEAAPRLHKAAFYARAGLGDRDGVVLSGDTVTLLPHAEVSTDVDAFDAAAEAAIGGDAAAVEAAVDRYAGDLLPDDLYEPWTEEPREQRRLRYLELLRELRRWEDVLAADPLDEDAHLALAAELIARGDRQGALRRLDRMEQVLRRELDVEPSPEAQDLREQALALPVQDTPRERPAARRMTPVPLPITPTVGRDQDLDRVLRLLEQARVLTLLGPGGVGKTRLAIEAALRRSEVADLEACFVDLTRVDDSDLVGELIGGEMGLSTAGRSPEQSLREALRGRSVLLVLDNFEHVVDAAALVSQLVRWSPDVQVLVTSRARLRIAPEQVYEVGPLSLDASPVNAGAGAATGTPEAVALFTQVARSVDPDFAIEQHRAEVLDICRQVDGLPLAIELAAGHVRTLSPTLLKARLRVRLGSPDGARRDQPSRQQTITATIDWSLALLGDDERRVFARLGVFAGPVPVEAIERVCADRDEDVVPVVGRLVDQSLVRRLPGAGGSLHFGLLELVRERARALLSDQELEVVSERHCEYLAATLEDLDLRRGREASGTWIDEIDSWLTEIRAAHTWAERHGDTQRAARITASLGTFWHRTGHHEEGRRWTAAALDHLDELSASLAARLQLTAGYLEWPRDLAAARRHWSTCAELCRSLGDDRNLAYGLALASGTYVGDDSAYEEALRMCEESIALARRVGERPLLAQALNIKGELARVHGDDDVARVVYEEGRDLAIAAGDDTHLSLFLANLGYLAEHRGDFEEARQLIREALRISWAQGRRMVAAWMVCELAAPEIGMGRPERAAVLIGAADAALHTLGATYHPGDRNEHEAVLDSLDRALGSGGLARLRAEGARLPLDDAIVMALSEPEVSDARPEAHSTSAG